MITELFWGINSALGLSIEKEIYSLSGEDLPKKKKKAVIWNRFTVLDPVEFCLIFVKCASAMTMANCLSHPTSLRQLLNLLKWFNLPSWQNIILVSRSPGAFWELLCCVKGSSRQVVFLGGPSTVWALPTWWGQGHHTWPLACAGTSQCFFGRSGGQLSYTISVRARCWQRISSKSRCTRCLHGRMSALRWFSGFSSVESDAIHGKRVSLGL